MLVPLGRRLMAAELPVLQAHDLSMWGYVVLLALDQEPVRTQAALAQAIGADKTRIIGVLDDLQRRGLIQREPDPADRRSRVLSLTTAGRRVARVGSGRDQAERGATPRPAPGSGRSGRVRSAVCRPSPRRSTSSAA